MAEPLLPFQHRKRMTHLAEVLSKRLLASGKAMISNYEIYLHLWNIYAEGKTPYLRGERPTKELFRRTRLLLKKEHILSQDHDYKTLWRVLTVSDEPADGIVCTADPYCYISHLSAMQRYGVSNRRPEALYVTQPPAAFIKKAMAEAMRIDYGPALDDPDAYIERRQIAHHPSRVRGRPLAVLTTQFHGEFRRVRGSQERIASIGQTFLDMLQEPDRCGGMLHVLETWQEHAQTYLSEILTAVDHAPKPIQKIRAGYILEERMGIRHPTVLSWKALAQRGSSRVLDPGKPFAERHSEEWMISINVG